MTNPESFGANTTNGKQFRLDPDSRQTVIRDEQGLVPTTPPAELGMLANLELLEVYDELEVLDGISDDETFELVAMLHTLDEEEPRP